jgi:hypothetical protein
MYWNCQVVDWPLGSTVPSTLAVVTVGLDAFSIVTAGGVAEAMAGRARAAKTAAPAIRTRGDHGPREAEPGERATEAEGALLPSTRLRPEREALLCHEPLPGRSRRPSDEARFLCKPIGLPKASTDKVAA